MKIQAIAVILFSTIASVYSQQEYFDAFKILKAKTDSAGITFKEAVFLVEGAYLGNLRKGAELQDRIDLLQKIVTIRELADSLDYNKKDKPKIKKYAAIFRVFTDTTSLRVNGTDTELTWLPMSYNFEDVFGAKDWTNMFVSKLLETKKGNCHSLPYLYKIICEELDIPCHLALAPNHLYIKHRSEKTGWYNVELTSGSFPIDAWLMASGYISLESVQKGIYLDTLSRKESIALCILDLAQGYNHKYPDNDGTFAVECCNLALKYFPHSVNAMLLKAETRLKQLQAMQKQYGYTFLKEVTAIPAGKIHWDEMNSLYLQLYKLGYRQMPEQMYVEWLTSLKTEKEKYNDRNVPGATKD